MKKPGFEMDIKFRNFINRGKKRRRERTKLDRNSFIPESATSKNKRLKAMEICDSKIGFGLLYIEREPEERRWNN